MSKYPNSGALFANSRKKTEKQPDYDGKIDVYGVEYRLAGWKRTSQNGKSYLSLKIDKAEKQQDSDEAF